MISMDLFLENVISPPILFFVLGLLAAIIKSDLKIPDQVGSILGIFILTSIGIRSGVVISKGGIAEVLLPALFAVFTGALLVIIAYKALTKITKLDPANAASVAGHYGAVSSVTLALSIVFLERIDVGFEGFVPALYPFIDIAALITAIVLGRISMAKYNNKEIVSFRGSIYEAMIGKSTLLLIGGFLIGYFSGVSGTERIMPFFYGMFPGVLTLFMLDIGLLAGKRLSNLLSINKWAFVLGLIMPPVFALIGIVIAVGILGLSPGGATIFAALSGGASYVSAPVVMRTAIPEANPSISLGMALLLTFPFNITVGIPLYYQAALVVSSIL